MANRLLDQSALHALLHELAERLARRTVRANVNVIGGAAIAEVESILASVFPGTTMSDRGRLMIDDLLAEDTD